MNPFIVILTALIIFNHCFASKNAKIEAHCYSFSLLPLDTNDGYMTYFTTYDGKTSYPLGFTQNIVSSEVKSSYIGSNVFYADYLSVSPYIGVEYYGALTITFPTDDSNGNGVLDFLEIDLAVNTSATYSVVDHWDYYGNIASLTTNVSFQRASGASVGSYTIITADGYSVTGEWALATWSGDIEYNENKQLSLSLSRQNPEGYTEYSSGSGTYEYSENQITLGVLSVSDSSGTITTQPANLARSGNTYSGPISLDDGALETPWSDFTDWKIFITDNNDEDSDGVPDLSDYIKRSLSQELDLDGWAWHNWPWVYSNSLKDWIYYYPSGVGTYAAWSNYHQSWFAYNYSTKEWTLSN